MSRTGGEAEYTHNFNMYHAAQQPWHGAYYYGAYGRPVALVVPPTSAFQTEWAWGVGQTKTRPIYHQFQMGVPATVGTDGGYRFAPTPYWPSSTEQFGVYPVRGPW